MPCTNCGFENRAERRFCSKCGAPLTIACPSCGFVNDPGDKFCGGCGVSVENARGEDTEPSPPKTLPSTPLGERRQVTIFFADLSEYTELADALDAEDLHDLVGRVFDRIDRVVEDHGGTVHRHVGDEVMALFGVPIAHGDDPLRAVEAAFETHNAMAALSAEEGRALGVHIGIASGEVVVAGQGEKNPQSVENYAVTGVAANLAARLNGMAGNGETIISNAVYRATEEHVDCESLGEVKVKGLENPVLTWRAKRLYPAGMRRERSPFVGRRSEMAQSRGVLEACRDTSNGHAILVRGEAGIGKSRLIEEIETVATELGFSNHKSFVLDFGVGRGQDAIRVLVRSLLGIPSEGDQGVRAAAADQALASGLYEGDQRVFLNDILDLSQPSEQRGLYDAMENTVRIQGKRAVVGNLIERLSATQPLLVTIENIHWADALILSHLAQITATLQNCAAVLVMTSRIESDPLDQAWRGSTRGSPLLTIDLGPLRKEEAMELAASFIDAKKELALNCVERAEGSPLFLEQLLRDVDEAGTDEIPTSIQGLVLARMDRLPDADKQALQAASVIGQCFAPDLLRHLLDDPNYSCTPLIEHYLVYPHGEDYLFAHALIQEGVYAALLKTRRHELHRRAADWFSNSDLVLQAEHLDRAEDPAAARAYIEAAREQAQLFHLDQSLKLAGRGLAVASDDREKYELLTLEGEYFHESGRPAESIAAYRDALEVAETEHGKCKARIGIAAGMRITDDYETALAELDLAESVARKQGLEKELSQIHYYRGSLCFPLGDIDRCLAEHKKALDHARSAREPDLEALALSGLGDAFYSQGRMITALDYFHRCMELCQLHHLGRIEVSNQYMVAWNRLYMNEVEGALEDSLAAVEWAVRLGHQRAEMVAELSVVRVLVEKNEIREAELHVERGLALAEWLGAKRFIPFFMIFMGRIWLSLRNDRWETVRLMEEGMEISRQTGLTFVGPWVASTLALVSEKPEDRKRALEEGEKILADGCVGHNYFAFYRDAIDVALADRDWEEVDRYVQSLADYDAPEPLPWCDFFIRRGRALADHHRGKHDDATKKELARLRDEAERVGLKLALLSLETALADVS